MEQSNLATSREHRKSNNNEFRGSEDKRSEFERDYGRLIHSASFRRLQGKSQVFGAGSGDFFRTRLTHSLEVAQIARVISGRLGRENDFDSVSNPGLVINPEVVECACLAHDIGHPPFGHKGEEILNEILADQEGFEGNAQNFRILMLMDELKNDSYGLDLTDAVLLAVNKYPHQLNKNTDSKDKGLYTREWEYINERRKSWGIPDTKATLEAQLMDLSDDIAYSTHDLEDGIRAGKISFDDGMNEKKLQDMAQLLKQELEKDISVKSEFKRTWTDVKEVETEVIEILNEVVTLWNHSLEKAGDKSSGRREFKSSLVNEFANSVGVVPELDWKRITMVKDNLENTHLLRKIQILKKLAWVTMINDFRVQRLQMRSETVLHGLWDVFTRAEKKGNIYNLLPSHWDRRKWQWDSPHRMIGDYIAGMTDAYAEKVYGEFFGGKAGSIYERD